MLMLKEGQEKESIAIKAVYDDYLTYCLKEDIIKPASKEILYKYVKVLFPHVKTQQTYRRGQPRVRIFTYLKKRILFPEPLQYNLPISLPNEYCVVEQSETILKLAILTKEYSNRQKIIKEITFTAGEVKAKFGGIILNLSTFGIQNKCETTEEFIALLNILSLMTVCRGREYEPVLANDPRCMSDIRHTEGDENATSRRIFCKGCEGAILLFNLGGSSCHTCTREICRYKKEKMTSKEPKDDTPLQSKSIPSENQSILSPSPNPDVSHKEVFPGAPPEFKALLSSQTRNLKAKGPNGRRWDPKIISLCLSTWCRSRSAYRELKDGGFLVLPSGRTLQRYKNCCRQNQV